MPRSSKCAQLSSSAQSEPDEVACGCLAVCGVRPLRRYELHVTGDSESLDRAFAALACFGEDRGLDRSLEIAADLNNIAKVSTLKDAVELLPSPNASAYADYLCRLGLLCTEEDEPAKIEEAALRCVPPFPPLLPLLLQSWPVYSYW